MRATGTFATPHASKYLQQLCKHFAHKVEVHHDTRQGTVALPLGLAELTADATTLTVTVTAPDAEGISRAQSVIDRHLVPFAFREAFERLDWQPAQP